MNGKPEADGVAPAWFASAFVSMAFGANEAVHLQAGDVGDCVKQVMLGVSHSWLPKLSCRHCLLVNCWQRSVTCFAQAQHVGDWSQGHFAEKPSLEGISGAHTDAQMLLSGSRAESTAADSYKTATAESKQRLMPRCACFQLTTLRRLTFWWKIGVNSCQQLQKSNCRKQAGTDAQIPERSRQLLTVTKQQLQKASRGWRTGTVPFKSSAWKGWLSGEREGSSAADSYKRATTKCQPGLKHIWLKTINYKEATVPEWILTMHIVAAHIASPLDSTSVTAMYCWQCMYVPGCRHKTLGWLDSIWFVGMQT